MSNYTQCARCAEHAKQVADLQAQISTQIEMLAAWMDAKTDLQAENARLRAALEAVEWVSEPGCVTAIDDMCCQWCGNWRGDGHRHDCAWQIAFGIAAT